MMGCDDYRSSKNVISLVHLAFFHMIVSVVSIEHFTTQLHSSYCEQCNEKNIFLTGLRSRSMCYYNNENYDDLVTFFLFFLFTGNDVANLFQMSFCTQPFLKSPPSHAGQGVGLQEVECNASLYIQAGYASRVTLITHGIST